ncbi:6609_t:CDS:2 [Ambispora gerdemannii]|uniref:6609_t:CDS:1 n=1 Tax=Ambispora gerdemannii TaxID=144530 RepID=A0A9N9CEP3_9GLOM|nr:6609_t:CDS:2 [Ambispora gerdemannii]
MYTTTATAIKPEPIYPINSTRTQSPPIVIPHPIAHHPGNYQYSRQQQYSLQPFSRPSSLRIHTYSHTGEKPFVCTEPGCGRKFSVQSNMRRHLRVHRLGRPVKKVRYDGEVEGVKVMNPGSRTC